MGFLTLLWLWNDLMYILYTLESEIGVGQGINVGPKIKNVGPWINVSLWIWKGTFFHKSNFLHLLTESCLYLWMLNFNEKKYQQIWFKRSNFYIFFYILIFLIFKLETMCSNYVRPARPNSSIFEFPNFQAKFLYILIDSINHIF